MKKIRILKGFLFLLIGFLLFYADFHKYIEVLGAYANIESFLRTQVGIFHYLLYSTFAIMGLLEIGGAIKDGK